MFYSYKNFILQGDFSILKSVILYKSESSDIFRMGYIK